jgi:hypothetical protein
MIKEYGEMKQELKILDPLDKAFQKMVKFCFQPFNFAKWLVMGFVTWIALHAAQYVGSPT